MRRREAGKRKWYQEVSDGVGGEAKKKEDGKPVEDREYQPK